MVAVGRSQLTLWFTEAISVNASSFDLRTQDGERLTVTVSAAEADGGGIVRLEADPLAKGTYVLDWRVLSLDDGHPSAGSVVFGAGTRPALVPAAGAGFPGLPELLLRWVDLAAIMLAIGALAVSGRVLGSIPGTAGAARRRARSVAALAAGVAVISGAETPLLRTYRGGAPLDVWLESTRDTLTSTPWGQAWMAREVALVVAAVALWGWSRRNGSGGRVRIAVLALVAVVWLESWAGHASALSDRTGLATLAAAAHLVAAGVWAGGLAVLALCLAPLMRRDPDARGPVVAAAWRAYSPMAAVATVVLVATGLYESGRHVPALGSVSSTLYGGVVAAKVVLVAVALVLAGINTLLVNPRLASTVAGTLGRPPGWTPVDRGRFRNVVALEAVVLLVAVGAAALLTTVPTAREIGAAARLTTPHTANVDGLFVTFEEVPAGPERTRLIVRARSTVKPERGPISGVDVLLDGPGGTSTPVSLDPVEPGRYEAEIATPDPGAWTASVAVQRAGQPDAVTKVAWTVASRAREGVRPLEAVTTGLAALLLAGLVAAVGLLRLRPDRVPTAIPPVRERTGSRR